MHKRMVDLVAVAKMRTQTNNKRHELVGIRWEGDACQSLVVLEGYVYSVQQLRILHTSPVPGMPCRQPETIRGSATSLICV
jgi:hypothetical protein